MQYTDEKSWKVVDDHKASALLTNPRALSLVEVFMRGPCTATSAARQLTMPCATAHRLTGKLVAIGVLQLIETRLRPGRAMKLFACSANAFFVPYELQQRDLPAQALRKLVEMRIDEQVRGLTQAAEAALGEHATTRWGTVIYPDRNGRLVVRPDYARGRTPLLLDEDTPAYLNFYVEDLRLPEKLAKQLQRELVDLIKRYKTISIGRPYTLSIVMAPRSRVARRA